MHSIVLCEQEAISIKGILSEITQQFKSSEDLDLLQHVQVYAHSLPIRIREHINEFKLTEPASGTCLISGYPINDRLLGDTPGHWKYRQDISPALEYEILLCLFGSLLGDMIAWATQQDGTIVHDVLPIKGHENEQLGSSSEILLTWHTEDAFHNFRADYVGLMCLRNPYRAVTTVSSIDQITISREHASVLFEPQYTLRPDESHLKKNQGSKNKCDSELLEASYRKMQEIDAKPQRVAVLYGDIESPYLRLDPYFMDEPDNAVAREALNALIKSIDDHLMDVVLEPGDFLFLDNYKTVHGRKPFKALYDGGDRWLKRINIARDLRKSRGARPSTLSRVLY